MLKVLLSGFPHVKNLGEKQGETWHLVKGKLVQDLVLVMVDLEACTVVGQVPAPVVVTTLMEGRHILKLPNRSCTQVPISLFASYGSIVTRHYCKRH